ncbi:MAG: COX15/CtaA family protein [Pseudomonadota bacterium]
MDAPYDLSPAAGVLLTGMAVALVPLVVFVARNRRAAPLRRLQALAALVFFLTFDLVLFGSFTRLTDSGLGCPDWPGCYGEANPVAAHAQISAAQAAMPTGPVTHHKAWIEMVHRYLAAGVGALIMVLMALAWVGWWRTRKGRKAGAAVTVHPLWPTATWLWVCLQGAFGWLTVVWKLFPAIVVAHLAGGIVLLALLGIQWARYGLAAAGRAPVALARGARALLLLALAVVAVQVLLGGWVSTNYAVLACSTFPDCNGSWWPAMDAAQGFEVWRPLGLLRDGSSITFPALVAIHYMHRLWAYAVLLVLALTAWRLWSAEGLRRPVRWLAALAALQLATGISNVVLDWPLVAALLHTGGAAALVAVLTWMLATSRAVPRTAASPSASSSSSSSPAAASAGIPGHSA